MPEITVYGDRTHQPLGRAIEELVRKVGPHDSKYGVQALHNRPRRLDFLAAEVTGLVTTGLGGLEDNLASGITARNGQFVWTLRWDWDPEERDGNLAKGEHVNLMIKGPGGTDKFAFLQRTEKGKPRSDTMYCMTGRRFTSDCGWSKRTYKWLPNAQQNPYLIYCAARGRRAMATRIWGRKMPEVECSPELSKLLYRIDYSKVNI